MVSNGGHLMKPSILDELESGSVRAAEKKGDQWVVNVEVKKAILDSFRQGRLVRWKEDYFDKDTLLPRTFDLENNIRLVPGGSAVRRGSYVAGGVIIMPPSYVNVGAYIDKRSMVDSHVLVGSCAQIGKGVHLSAGVQIGGVLEPVGESPVIVEDNAFIGAGAILVEGVRIGEGAVIAPGAILSRSIPIFDCVAHKRLGQLSPPRIPSGAVVIPGSRSGICENIEGCRLSAHCALIVKYRDAGTDASIELESALRTI